MMYGTRKAPINRTNIIQIQEITKQMMYDTRKSPINWSNITQIQEITKTDDVWHKKGSYQQVKHYTDSGNHKNR